MKIIVVGAGAMGSIYAGLFADAGNEVTIVSRNQEHRAVIENNGLRISGASGDRTVQLTTLEKVPAQKYDLVIVAVKALDVPAIADQLGALLHPESLVVTIQNGLGSADVLANAIGNERLLVGIAGGFGASLKAPGHTHHKGMQKIQIGSYAGGPDMNRCESIAKIWQQAGFNAIPTDNILVMQWEKLICNVAYSAICTLNGLTVGEVTDHPLLGPASLAAAREAFDVANALSLSLSIKDPNVHVLDFAAQVFDAKPSMLADHLAKRESEINYINGAVPREAAKINRAAPLNLTLTALVSYRESEF